MVIWKKIPAVLCCLLLLTGGLFSAPAHAFEAIGKSEKPDATTEIETDAPSGPGVLNEIDEPARIDTAEIETDAPSGPGVLNETDEPARIAGAEIETDAPSGPGVLNEIDEPVAPIAVSRAMFMTPELLLLPQGADVETLTLPTDIIAMYGRFGFLSNLSVLWDITAFDAQQTGMQSLSCQVLLPKGYAYYIDGAEAPLYIEQPIWVYSQEMAERETVNIYHGPIPIDSGINIPPIPLDSSNATLEEMLALYCRERMRLETASRLLFSCDYDCDLTLIDTKRSGYHYPFLPKLPPGIEIAEKDLRANSMAILVVDPDRVDLSGVRIDDANRYSLYGEWLYEAENPIIWVSETSPLEEDEDPLWQEMQIDQAQQQISLGELDIVASISDTHLYLWFENPPESGEYWFQVRYEGGESNYLHVAIDHDQMIASSPNIGDRFGDTDGNQTPPKESDPTPPSKRPSGEQSSGTQQWEIPAHVDPIDDKPDIDDKLYIDDKPDIEAGLPDSTDPDERQAIIAEVTTTETTDVNLAVMQASPADDQVRMQLHSDITFTNSVAFTGTELRALMAAKPEYVPFRKGDVEVWLPTAALELLGFDDTDVIAVHTEHLPYERLTVHITVNDEPVVLSQEFFAGTSWDEHTQALWHDAEGNAIPCEYRADDGTLRLTFSTPCTVYFSGIAPSAAQPEESNLQPLLANIQPPSANPPAQMQSNIVFGLVVGFIMLCAACTFVLVWRKRRLRV